MYMPTHFRENDTRTLHQFIQEYSFGILVAQHEGTPVANHLPFLLDARTWFTRCAEGAYGAGQCTVAHVG